MSPGAQVPGARPAPRRTGRGFEHVIAQETLWPVVSDDQGVPSFGTVSDEPEEPGGGIADEVAQEPFPDDPDPGPEFDPTDPERIPEDDFDQGRGA